MELPTNVKLLGHKHLQNKARIEQTIIMKLNRLFNSEITFLSISHVQYFASHNRSFFTIFLGQFVMFHSVTHSRKDPAGTGIGSSRLRVPPMTI